jgi:hypothetical protein
MVYSQAEIVAILTEVLGWFPQLFLVQTFKQAFISSSTSFTHYI